MKLKRVFFCLYILSVSLYGLTQTKAQSAAGEGDTALVNTLIQQSKEYFTSDPEKAIDLSTQAKNFAEKIHFSNGAAYALKNIGIVYYFQGKHLEALNNYSQSLKIFEEIKDNIGIANLYSNIGVVYYDRGDDAKALENYLQSLKFSELAGDKFRILTALNNVGAVYNIKTATYDKALEYYLKALQLCEELNKKEELGAICVNIGSIYFEKNDDEKALFYFNKSLKAYGNSEGSLNSYNALGKLYKKEAEYDLALKSHDQALAIAEKLNNKISIVQSLMGVGNVYKDQGNNRAALLYFKKAEIPAIEIQANHELKDLYQEMASTYSKAGDYSNAFKYQTLFSNIKDTLYNVDTDKKLGTLQFDFDLQKKQSEINLLTKDNALNELELKRQKFAKTALGSGLVLVFFITLLIFRNYRNKVKVNKLLDSQKAQIEQLLLNILPAEVATELQSKGQATPRYYEQASVLFTDFVGFTRIADSLSPQEVVAELNECFVAFDKIIENHKLEKIKTIGDSYMCAGGIPVPDEEHTINIIKASLDIQEQMRSKNEQRRAAGQAPWELRIGIHTGPMVAGVVGKNKYAYDIWGSTVNIASRMESNGEPGKVNISSATYDLIKGRYNCIYRGKIFAKNVGEVDMYFVEQEISAIIAHGDAGKPVQDLFIIK